MGLVIQNMITTQYALDKQSESLKKLKKSSERLSTGYRINRAADDAAGLAVSEKLRSIKRGLRQGLRNIDDGISFVRTVEGASQEIHNILQRLKEIAVQAENGTYDDAVDRKALDLEYQQLLDEIDQMTDNADFNGVPLFEKHLSAYEKVEGDVKHGETVRINAKNDTLTLGYIIDGVAKECTVTIPHGSYSPEEIADMIDSELINDAPELIIGVNVDNQFTMQVEGGSLDHLSGSASSLFYNTVIGSSDGYLLGVTVFRDENVTMPVIAGQNDTIAFRVGNTDDTLYSIKLDAGNYNRTQLVDAINQKLTQAGIPGDVEAVKTENDKGQLIIGLASESTITGLSGNFIKMDGITSPIYDICKYGSIDNSQAVLSGTKRIVNDLVIERGRNDYFVLNFKYYGDDASAQSKTLRIDLLDASEDRKIYASPTDLIDTIQQQIDAADIPFTVSLNAKGGIDITSDQFGNKCDVKLNTSNVPSPYMVYDLFDAATLNKVTPAQGSSTYSRAIFTAYKPLGPTVPIPAAENTLSFDITVSDDNEAAAADKTVHRIDVVIPPTTYSTTDELVQAMNDYLDNNYPDIADKLQFSIDASNTLKLYAEGPNSSCIERIAVDTASSAYNRLIAGSRYYDNISTVNGTESAYQTSSNTVPGTSRANVTSSSGSTVKGTQEVKEQSSTSQKSDTYIRYSGANVDVVDGKTVYEQTEGIVGGVLKEKTPAKITLDDVLTQFSVPGKSEKDITFSFDLEDDKGSESYSIVIPKGSTSAQAMSLINEAIKGRAKATSSGSDIIIKSDYSGAEAKFSNVTGTLLNKASKSSLASSSGAVVENNTVYVPATLTVKNALSQIPYAIDGTNNNLVMTAGQHTYDLRLTEKTYTSLSDLAAEINAQIAAADGGTPATTVKVGTDGKSLIFTGPLKESGNVTIDEASTCRIGYTKKVISNSTPNYNPATGNVENPASIRTEGIDTHFPKTVTSADNTITMDYTHPDPTDPDNTVTETLTITIPDGTYNNATEFTNAINSAIAADPDLSGKITASYASSGSNKGLTFKTVNGGDGYRLSNLGGTAAVDKYISKASTSGGGEVDTSTNTVKYPAKATNNQYGTLFSGNGVEITDSNDHVALTINGTLYEFDITHGVYKGASGRADLTTQLRNGLAAANVTITDDGTNLIITTNDKGLGKSISLNSANTSPYFKRAVNVSSPTSTRRVESPCYILGKNSISSIDIKSYNNKMTFEFTQDGNTYPVEVQIAEGTYTAASLAQAIQDSINQTLPANSLEVYTNGSGNIGIRSATITPLRTIGNFKGGLFDKVFQNASYSGVTRHSEKAGTSTGSYLTYIVGRNDLGPETEDEFKAKKNVIIYPALNDQLIFDLRYDGETYKVEFNIPAGEYMPRELAAAIQTAGREAINKMTDKNGDPFPQDTFKATIGLADLGLPEPDTAIKSGDKLVLSFNVPDDGTVDDLECIIDGVRGSAAYRIFYEATQSPTPSKVIGKADLTNGIMIRTGENDTFSYDLDGTTYSVTIPEGTYTCDQLYEYLNSQYEQTNSIVRCTNMDGHLMFYTIENGDYDIDKFVGSAADDIFYGSESRESDSEIGIHTGRRTDTYIWYLRTRVDDHLMRINTTGVTTAPRAAKAMDRVDAAVNYLSRWRALSGANENRSRHTHSRNTAYVENLEQADSTLRDADIATETAELAKQQILLQAQNAMIEQSKQQHSSIMDVLA